MLTLFVSLTVRPDSRARFLKAIETQASRSLQDEPGCLRFDVCVDRDDPNRFLLYEIYADEAAFENHRSTPHFAEWRRAADAYVLNQVNHTTELLLQGAANANETNGSDPTGTQLEGSLVLRPATLDSFDRGGDVRTVYLVGSHLGASAFTNGMTHFDRGASLPMHSHNCQESVTILEGEAWFEDKDGLHELNPGDTTLVPEGAAHRFINRGESQMSILWTYGSTSPTRTLADTGETSPAGLHVGIS